MKKLNNKGFSLVELIIVIAIMAVLIAVLAPQFLRYIERSRLQSDNTAIGEIANACKVAATDETITGGLGTDDYTITPALTAAAALTVAGGDSGAGLLELQNELKATIGNMALTSNTYVSGAQPTIVIHLDPATRTVTVTGTNYIESVGAGVTTPTF